MNSDEDSDGGGVREDADADADDGGGGVREDDEDSVTGDEDSTGGGVREGDKDSDSGVDEGGDDGEGDESISLGFDTALVPLTAASLAKHAAHTVCVSQRRAISSDPMFSWQFSQSVIGQHS